MSFIFFWMRERAAWTSCLRLPVELSPVPWVRTQVHGQRSWTDGRSSSLSGRAQQKVQRSVASMNFLL